MFKCTYRQHARALHVCVRGGVREEWGGGGQFCDTDVCGLMWAVRYLFLVQCVLNS